MLTATKTVKTAVDAMKLGAFDYLTKPFDVDELRLVLEQGDARTRPCVREVEELRTEVGRRYQLDNIIGRSPRHAGGLQDRAHRGAAQDHRADHRRERHRQGADRQGASTTAARAPRKPLVTLNCAAIPETLLESELFGHERGSFTDAHAKKLGQFELAHEGTLFLDEIGEMGAGAAGEAAARARARASSCASAAASRSRVDVRIIAATNRDLDGGDPRRRVPRRPLLPAERRHGAPAAAARAARRPAARSSGTSSRRRRATWACPRRRFTPEAVDALLRYPWPGNVRELENLIERAAGAVRGPERSTLDDLPEQVAADRRLDAGIDQGAGARRAEVARRRGRRVRARDHRAKRCSRPTSTRRAPPSVLGTTRRILKYRMDKLGIDASDRNGASHNGHAERNGASRLHLDR